MISKTEQSRIAYNKIAAEYDAQPEGRYTRFHIAELSGTVELCDDDFVLDVACGNGTLLGELSKKAKIYAHGIDVSENMICASKTRYPNICFEAKPCYPLEFDDESCDVITVCCAFHHFENPQGFANECKRVLKKNGAVYVADPNFNAAVRFLANAFWLPFSKSGDVRIYGKKSLAKFFHNAVSSVRNEVSGERRDMTPFARITI